MKLAAGHLKEMFISKTQVPHVTYGIQFLSSMIILVLGFGFTLIICTLINKAFIHGDLHVGSIMVTQGNTYVFDLEFATYGMILAYSAFFVSHLNGRANLYISPTPNFCVTLSLFLLLKNYVSKIITMHSLVCGSADSDAALSQLPPF